MLERIAFVFALYLLILISPFFLIASAEFDGPRIILRSSFVDSEDRVNVVGTVRNFAQVPVQVTIGLPTLEGKTLETETYGRTIWPLTDSPFKFILLDGESQAGDPFLKNVTELNAVRHDMLILTYDGMAVGEERAFVGKIKNTGPFEVQNVSVFAAVHNTNHTLQLDTVRSNVLSVIKPGEELDFVAVPDPVVRPDVLYYSCAGLDYDDPITTVKVGDSKILAYDLTAAAQIRNFRYDNSTDSLAFGIRPYIPSGGDVSLKIAQLASNQTVTVVMDGKAHDSFVKSDGRTMTIDFFVPEGSHEIQVQGVRNIPEIHSAVIVFAGITGVALALLRSWRAFKIS
ncbi:MAG TPA: hypothetical protein VGQ03_06875 [Nitrososphaera sp.]|jgi:hypothetical protein|nr:hypothetical protein [Nitrososphaera sp.]